MSYVIKQDGNMYGPYATWNGANKVIVDHEMKNAYIERLMPTPLKKDTFFDVSKGRLIVRDPDNKEFICFVRPVQISPTGFQFFACDEYGTIGDDDINRWHDYVFTRDATVQDVIRNLQKGSRYVYEYKI